MYDEHANHLNELKYGLYDDATVVTDTTTAEIESDPEERIPANSRHMSAATNLKQAWKHILQVNNLYDHPNADQMLNTMSIQRAVE